MVVVKDIDPDGLGYRAGFRPGDQIRAINGQQVGDLIDFQVHSGEEILHIEVARGAEVYDVEVSRSPGESLGLSFEDMDLSRCDNKCVFCFIHQMPRGLRRSLYLQDDDYRLSFLHGSYVTLTNVGDEGMARIVEQNLSPQYISVHTTDPELRKRMLGRQLAVDILERIGQLSAGGIEMHAQVVICPGWNDGPHLRKTVDDLSAFYPALRSVALVPVGLTRYRQHLPHLEPVTPDRARLYLAQATEWGRAYEQQLGERLVHAADELWLLAGEEPPSASYYDTFPQVENGIGMVRSFLDTWEREKSQLAGSLPRPVHLGLVTGQLARPFMAPVVEELNEIADLQVDLVPVDNDFFGHGITVSGLLAGEDVCKRIAGGRWERVFLPPNCVNPEGLTLDGMTVEQLAAEARVPLAVGAYDLASCLQAYVTEGQVALTGRARVPTVVEDRP